MRIFWMGLAGASLVGCAPGAVALVRPVAVTVEPTGTRARNGSATSETQRGRTESDEPAEPFSASWLEPQSSDDGAAPEAWVDSEACPAPLEATGGGDFELYDAFIDKALGLVARPDPLVVLRIAPSFAPSRVLSVIRRADGSYLLRSTQLTTNVWAQMMAEMHALQGSSISLDEQSQADALARVVTSKVAHETKIAASTAQLIAELWRSLIARAQVTEEIGIATDKSDGTFYELWQRGAGATAHSPAWGSVLGDVVLATEHLENAANGPAMDKAGELEAARALLQSSLERTRRQEPCLRRYTR